MENFKYTKKQKEAIEEFKNLFPLAEAINRIGTSVEAFTELDESENMKWTNTFIRDQCLFFTQLSNVIVALHEA